MGYRLTSQESVADGLRRVAAEQLQKALDDLDAASDDLHEAVHGVRKRCKKLRGLLRLVRPALGSTYQRENACLRDTAKELSPLRDATALLECHELVVDGLGEGAGVEEWAEPLEAALRDRRSRLVSATDVEATLAGVRKALAGAAERSGSWSLDAEEFDAVGPGLAKTYARGRDAMRGAYEDPTTERFHEWRKRAKYHRYHLALLRDLWPGVVSALRDEAHDLTDLLGDDHDLAVYTATLREEADLLEALAGHEVEVLRSLDDLRRDLQDRARPLGLRLFAEDREALLGRWGVYHRAGREVG